MTAPVLTVVVDNMTAMPDFEGTGSCSRISFEMIDELFYPDSIEVPDTTKRICGACPIVVECREWARTASGGHGIWAGEWARDILANRARKPHGSAKLDEVDVLQIRDKRSRGWKVAAIAEEHGVSWDAVQDILTGRTWKHVA